MDSGGAFHPETQDAKEETNGQPDATAWAGEAADAQPSRRTVPAEQCQPNSASGSLVSCEGTTVTMASGVIIVRCVVSIGRFVGHGIVRYDVEAVAA